MRRYRKVLTYGIAIALGGLAVTAGPSLAHLFTSGASSSSPASPSPERRAASSAGLAEGSLGRLPAGEPAALAPGATHEAALAAPSGQPSVVPGGQADVIRTGSIDIQVGRKDLQTAFNDAGQSAARLGGFVASSTNGSAPSSSPSASLVLRVPSASFLQLVQAVGGLGKIENEALQGDDVTTQVIDVAARIANLQVEQAALRQLIGKAGSIPQILQVEDQLFSVEQQIEELSAQQSSLANQVTYATLNVNLGVVALAPVKPRSKAPVNAAVRAARTALHNSAASIHGVVIALGEAFPAIVLLAIGAALFGWLRSRRGSSTPAEPSVPSGATA